MSDSPLSFTEIGKRAKPPFIRQTASRYIHGYLSPNYVSYSADSKGWTTTPAGVELLSNSDMIDVLVGRKPKRTKGRQSSKFLPSYRVPRDLMDTKLLRLRSMIMRSVALSVEASDAETTERFRIRILKTLEAFVNELTRIYKEDPATRVVVGAEPRKGIFDAWKYHVQVFLRTLSELPLSVSPIEVPEEVLYQVEELLQKKRLARWTLPAFHRSSFDTKQLDVQPNDEKASLIVLPTAEGFLRWQLATIVEMATDYKLIDIDELRKKLTKAGRDLGWELRFDNELTNIDIHRSQPQT